jgi:sulfate adenylyltransferase subunit 2
MNKRDLGAHQWQSLAESWLIAELRANAAQSVASVWDASRLAEQIELTLQIKKSKRTWERFLANLPFLEVTTTATDIRDDTGRPARTLIINQLIREAQRARRPVHFLEIHSLQDFYVVATSTTKGKKVWLSIKEKINKSEVYESIFSQTAGGSGLLVPNKEAVGWLRDAQRAVSMGTTQKGLSSIRAPWFGSLIAFHDPLTEPEAGKASQAESTWSQSNGTEGIHPRNKRRMIEEQSMSNANMNASLPAAPLSHLDRLEAESIHIMREVMAHSENPVMLYSIGKDSSVMLHLARKAFFPSTPPFPLLHVDTRWKFRAMYEFREKMAQESGMELLVHINPEGVAKNINPFDHGSALHTDIMKTEGLKQALDAHQFDVAFGGARRDEEKSRAKERIFSFRNQAHRWDPKNQRPELWNLYNCRKNPGESIRVFPLSNWTELDIWQYIYRENISIVPLYFAAERPVVERNGMLIMVDDDRMQLLPDEKITSRRVRFRTLGCYPLTGAINSNATDLADIVLELLQSTTSERQGRAIDTDSSGSMEKKKQEGYF